MNKITHWLFILLMLPLLFACNGNDDDSSPSYPNFSSAIYAGDSNWLCHPKLTDDEDVCRSNLDATIVYPDGSSEVESHSATASPAIDCFYVYPTASSDPGGNADLEQGDEEQFSAINQVARYNKLCRVFAPVYRQTTVASIFLDLPRDSELAYSDVAKAFKHYIANSNNGRGFILIGHSQGSVHLRRLIQEEIETNDYLLERLVAAHLIGYSIQIPEGGELGGDFQRVPACRTATDTACVLSFASYRDSDPFLAAGEARFGLPGDNSQAICTNPALLEGGRTPLDAYFPVNSIPALEAVLIRRVEGPYADPGAFPAITTSFYKMPGFLEGECVLNSDGIHYLQVTANTDPADPRADDYNGEFTLGDGWGLHLMDINLALGDLLNAAQQQAESWLQEQD